MTELTRARTTAQSIVALLEAASVHRAEGARARELVALHGARLKCFDLRATLDRLERAAGFGDRGTPGQPTGGNAA